MGADRATKDFGWPFRHDAGLMPAPSTQAQEPHPPSIIHRDLRCHRRLQRLSSALTLTKKPSTLGANMAQVQRRGRREYREAVNEEIQECYRLLEVSPDASPEVVKQAYRDLIKIWHPDRFPDDVKFHKRANEKAKQLNEAYRRIIAFQSHQDGGRRTGRQAGDAAQAKARPEPGVREQARRRREEEGANRQNSTRPQKERASNGGSHTWNPEEDALRARGRSGFGWKSWAWVLLLLVGAGYGYWGVYLPADRKTKMQMDASGPAKDIFDQIAEEDRKTKSQTQPKATSEADAEANRDLGGPGAGSAKAPNALEFDDLVAREHSKRPQALPVQFDDLVAGEHSKPATSAFEEAHYFAFGPSSSAIAFFGSKVTGSHNGGFRNFAGEFRVSPASMKPISEVTRQSFSNGLGFQSAKRARAA